MTADVLVAPPVTLDVSRPNRADAVRARLRAAGPSLLILTPLLVAVGVTHGIALGSAPGFLDDEGTYAAQAWSVLHQGHLSPYTYWYDHPPLGWLQLAGWLRLTGLTDTGSAVTAARTFAVACAVVSAALLFVLGRRAGMRRWTAALAVAALAACPLALNLQRLAYLDNFAMPWVLGAFVLALSPRRRLWAAAVGGCFFGVAVLTKETSLLLAPGLVAAAALHARRRTRTFVVTGLVAGAALVIAFYPLFAALKGELLPGPGHVSLLDAIRFQLWGRPSGGSPLTPGSLSRQVVNGWLSIDRWLLYAGGAGAVLLLAVRRLRFVGVTVVVLTLMALRPGYLPAPYVIAALPFAALGFAGAVDVVASSSRRWWTSAVAAGLAVAAAVAVTPAWAAGDTGLWSQQDTAATRQAVRWLGGHVPHHDRVITDDAVWVDLVHEGFDPRLGVIWMYKLDFATSLDPSVRRALPDGWRDCQYLLETPAVRGAVAGTPGGLPEIKAALAHSRVVATFGTGGNTVRVRRLETSR